MKVRHLEGSKPAKLQFEKPKKPAGLVKSGLNLPSHVSRDLLFMCRLMLARYRLEKYLRGHLLLTAASEVLAFNESAVGIFDVRASAETVLEALQL